MWIVKLGGSLATAAVLPAWLQLLADAARAPIAVVPGGGPFADQVRRLQRYWRFGDPLAHGLAVEAMRLYGHFLCGLNPGLVPVTDLAGARAAQEHARVAVWCPAQAPGVADGLSCDWQVSADSLAAWLAGTWGARGLILVKAVRLRAAELSATELAARGIVDAAFPAVFARAQVPGVVLGRADLSQAASLLTGQGNRDGAVRIGSAGAAAGL